MLPSWLALAVDSGPNMDLASSYSVCLL